MFCATRILELTLLKALIMKKLILSLSLTLSLLMLTPLTATAAETGSYCTEHLKNEVAETKLSIENGFDIPITLRVPRNEWICSDWSGWYTPGRLDGVVLRPKETRVFVLDQNATSSTMTSSFTIRLENCISQSTCQSRVATRVAINALWQDCTDEACLRDTQALFYVRNPNQWVYAAGVKSWAYRDGFNINGVRGETTFHVEADIDRKSLNGTIMFREAPGQF